MECFIDQANAFHQTIKFTTEISENEITFFDTVVFKGDTVVLNGHYTEADGNLSIYPFYWLILGVKTCDPHQWLKTKKTIKEVNITDPNLACSRLSVSEDDYGSIKRVGDKQDQLRAGSRSEKEKQIANFSWNLSTG